MYVLIGILLLGILIAVHEFGHFIAARLCGIEVMEFAIGMGPKLFSWTGKKGTKFSLRCIPLGGFCAFYGEDDATGQSKDDPRAYNRQPVWKRIITVAMGPVMNFVLAFVVAVALYATMDIPVVEPQLQEITPGSAAEEAGLMAGDIITAVDGESVLDGTISALQSALQGKEQYTLTVRREEASFEVTVSPRYVEAEGRALIGITYSGYQVGSVHLTFVEALQAGTGYCLEAGAMVFQALGGLFTDPAIRDQVAGPVGAVAIVSDQVQQGGAEAFFGLMVAISVNLGIMNLLPIPGLDGSRIVFHVIEAVRRKPIKPEREAMVHLIGMAFLFAMMIYFTFKDVFRLIG